MTQEKIFLIHRIFSNFLNPNGPILFLSFFQVIEKYSPKIFCRIPALRKGLMRNVLRYAFWGIMCVW